MFNAKMSKEGDLENRDPNSLSEHVQVSWEEVFGEPESIRSPECAWRLSNQCFRGSKHCCYIFLSVLLAPLTALLCGFCFACVAFENIWCAVPCLRLYKITCGSVRSFIMVLVQAVIIPLTNGCGHLLSAIRVKTQTIEDGSEKKEDIMVI